jgi:pantoate--beta-alanine ligase
MIGVLALHRRTTCDRTTEDAVLLQRNNLMKQITTVQALDQWVQRAMESGDTIGFVPTMGALHEGHLSLIRQSVKENDLTVCSIFVNPIQFNNPADLERYPQMPEEDAQMLTESGCDMLFSPTKQEMYPAPVEKLYDFGSLDRVMEGAFRPGHFNGVAIVVDRLFRLVRPSRAYFGLKDYQQLLVIREMVRQEGHPVQITGCPIVREADGLAMSSRNLRLTVTQRANAPEIYRILSGAASGYHARSVEELSRDVFEQLKAIPEAVPEYVTFADAASLMPIKQWEETTSCILCVAVYLGEIRLIDNIVLYQSLG